jgi:hypothetical protein
MPGWNGGQGDGSEQHVGAPRPASDPTDRAGQFLITRRDLLRYSGGLVIVTRVGSRLRIGEAVARSLGALPPSDLTLRVIRPLDQLALTFDFFNLKLLRKGQAGPGDKKTARLVRIKPTAAAFVVVDVGVQSLGEHAYFEGDTPATSDSLPSPPIPASLASDSRLGFRIPAAITFIPYDLDTLLGWERWVPSIVPAAHSPTGPGFHPAVVQPNALQTALEVPWLLDLSPSERGGWAHAHSPVSHVTTADNIDRTELWHTRLGVLRPGPNPTVDEQDAANRTVRAVWTPGATGTPPPTGKYASPVGQSSLTTRDRYDIVRLNTDYSAMVNRKPYVPLPEQVHRLYLSMLGAHIDLHGAWPTNVIDGGWTSSIVQWDHRAALGRDDFVRVMYPGFLFPFGHEAVLVKIAERKAQPASSGAFQGHDGAYLRLRFFIVVRNPLRDYSTSPGVPFAGRGLPFGSVRMATLVTSNLNQMQPGQSSFDPLTEIDDSDGNPFGQDAFWPRAGSEDFLFHLVATDLAGAEVELTAPLIFVSNLVSNDQPYDSPPVSPVEDVIAHYEQPSNTDRRTRDLGGQTVAYSALGGDPTKSQYEARTMRFGASLPDPKTVVLDRDHQPRFYPVMEVSEVRMQAVEQVRGGPLADPTAFAFHDHYLNDLANDGQVFGRLVDPATLADAPVQLSFGGGNSGALITPNMSISGVSALTGPVGGNLATMLTKFSSEDFFSGVVGKLPKILGGIVLWGVISDIDDLTQTERIPKLLSQPVPPDAPVPDEIVTSLEWDPTPKSYVLSPTVGTVFEAGVDTTIAIKAVVTQTVATGASSVTISGLISNFKVHMLGDQDPFGVISLDFDHLGFTSKDGQKPDLDVGLAETSFSGVLFFISKLQDFMKTFLPLTGDNPSFGNASDKGGGLGVEVDDDAINVKLFVEIPDLEVGVFTIANIAFSTEVNIPFIGDPARVRFAFATREQPFHITVSCIGGGGFVGLAFGLDGFEMLEAALEAGAQVALDFKVAQASVSLFIGIYFKLEVKNGNDQAELTGYVRLNGDASLLGIVHVAIELYLALVIDFGPPVQVCGQASLTVSVAVAFFSVSVTIGPVQECFAGGGGGGGGGVPTLRLSGTTASGADARIASTPDDNPITFQDLFVTQGVWNTYADLYAGAAFP